MDVGTESGRLGAEYRAALKYAQECEVFWHANPIVYSVGDGQRLPATQLAVYGRAAEYSTPDQAWRRAMAALDRWRAFRAAHGMP
jgi:hypothetical protein